MTYPPRPVNGFMISGFDTPSIDVEFTYPRELKQKILQRWPEYTYKSDWKRKALGGNELFQRNLRHIEQSFVQGQELAFFCADRYDWDVLMVLYKLVDNLQHKAWKYLDPRTAGRNPKRTAMAARSFAVLDESLGKLFAMARKENALVLIMSDHGHGSLEGKAQPNALLERWGYLKIKSRLKQSGRRAAKIFNRMIGRTTKRFEANLGIEHDLELDWPQTKACVMHAGIYGFLYLNLKGRRAEGGSVEPDDYEKVRDDLIRRFRAERCTTPDGQKVDIFPEVHKPEELYGCTRAEQPWMPDLLLVPYPGLAVVRKIRGSVAVRWSPPHRLEGTHRVEGVLVANGPHVPAGVEVRAGLADIAPTLLATLGLRVPANMEGRVIDGMFDQTPTVEFEPAQAIERPEGEEVYTDAEKEALAKRLADLGYLE
jgi:predicted AlkP superfamily phosphohydrolase/phosphomutase